ncbi:MAG: hypothetical protein LBS56_07135 [Propionibacteriaceae bacterium]|jgi:hypothetical protein|nr:hypothetical protein [Propionibacteriaceae bacterium]
MTDHPPTNTHVHLPPNFSAFGSVEEAVAAARAEGVPAIGISNFFDQRVYARFAAAAERAGVTALFGLEFITLDPELEAQGIRVNDPANPGRMYMTGKGIDPFREKSPETAALAAAVKRGNDERAEALVQAVAAWFLDHGVDWGRTAAAIAQDVADRAGVPVEWVSLQERHIARAVHETLVASAAGAPSAPPAGSGSEAILAASSGVPSGSPPGSGSEAVLAASPGVPSASPPWGGSEGVLAALGLSPQALADPAGAQGTIRAKLLKAGRPAFVPEAPLSFAEAFAYVTQMGGIPCYPVVADGCDPICPFEESPGRLAAEIVRRGVHAAELIPNRNRTAVVDDYVRAFEDAGLIVVAGTEHNTPDMVPLAPTAKDGPLSDLARSAFWRGVAVVAAHQRLVGQGQPGYVDSAGARTSADIGDLAEFGARIIGGRA